MFAALIAIGGLSRYRNAELIYSGASRGTAPALVLNDLYMAPLSCASQKALPSHINGHAQV